MLNRRAQDVEPQSERIITTIALKRKTEKGARDMNWFRFTCNDEVPVPGWSKGARDMAEVKEREYKHYHRTQIAEMADWEPGFDMEGVSISAADQYAGSPKLGDKIARNPANHADKWLVAKAYFDVNFAAVASHAPATAGSERNELLHELECWGVIYDPQQVVEGEEPWEVICEPEPQYFDTFKEAFKFFMSLKDNPERDSPAPSAPQMRLGTCKTVDIPHIHGGDGDHVPFHNCEYWNLWEAVPTTGKEELPQVVRDSPLCTICGNHSMDDRFHHAASTEENQCGFGSYAGSAPSSSTFTTTSADGAVTDTPHTSVNISAGTAVKSSESDPTATQSGASAAQGARDGWKSVEDAWVRFAAKRGWKSAVLGQNRKQFAKFYADEQTESLQREVERLKAERDALIKWKESAMKQLGKSDQLHKLLPEGKYWGWDVYDATVDYVESLRSRMDVALKTDEVK